MSGVRIGTALAILAGSTCVAFAQSDGVIAGRGQASDTVELTDEQMLGRRLFEDIRLCNPGSDVNVSCATCHVPNANYKGERAYADSVARSIVPSRAGGRDLTLRNTPTLLDVAGGSAFNHDGEFDSLEKLIEAKLYSRQFGWSKDEDSRVSDEIKMVVEGDTGVSDLANGTYIEEFKRAFDVDVAATTPDDVVTLVAKALSSYVRTLQTTDTAPYDAFGYLNRVNAGMADTDTPDDFSFRLFGLLANQEGRLSVKWPKPYDETAYQGLKTFYRVPGEGDTTSIGNCVACHHPPHFTDYAFHNTGVVQMSYDADHGDGAFAKVDAGDRGDVDLGRGNHIDDEAAVGAFKTPPLRNLGKTDPYMHNGAYETLEDVIRQKIRASELAKAGKLRNADPELSRMNISEEDVEQLAAFLRTLDEVAPENYRDIIIKDVDTRKIIPE
jgi:cytochrome c peroxidase